MAAQQSEEERARRRKAMEDLPPLPPLLAQILAEARAKQEKKANGGAVGEGAVGDGGEAKPPSGPLFLEAAPTQVITGGQQAAEPPSPRDSDSEEDESEAEAARPPGDLDASRCRAHGPGFSGGAAGAPVKLTITARDSGGKRIKTGGAHVLVMVEPVAAPGAAEEPEPIQAEVQDHGNGNYTASYTVPTKGNYELHIEVNGDPVGDSPYPIFFSAPAPQPAAPPPPPPPVLPPPPGVPQLPPPPTLPAPIMTAGGVQIVTAAALKQAHAAQQPPGAPLDVYAQAALQSSLGFQLVQMGMRFPALTDDQLLRMVVASGVPPHADSEALKSVFSFCGAIRSATPAGGATGFAFVEFTAPHEAAAALAMSGATLMGQPLKVELAAEAKKGADFAATQVPSPYLALQAQQVQQFQMMQQQQTALAQQVLAMRAAQRAGLPPGQLLPPPPPPSSDSQKSAAVAAAIALSKRLAGGCGEPPAAANAAKAAANGKERRRSRSRSRDRKRSHRSRSRDRGGSRRGGSRERKRSRSRGRRGGSRERGLKRSSHHRSSRSRERRHHKEREHKERRSHRDRDGRRERERGRGHSGEREGKSSRRDSREGREQEGGEPEQQAVPAAGQPKDELEALIDELED